MNDNTTTTDDRTLTIIATQVPQGARLAFLPKHFKYHMMTIENYIYSRFRTPCPSYTGGYWDFYELSNGGCYLAPNGELRIIENPENYFSDTVSADAAGIIITLYTMSELSFRYENETLFGTHFHWLREYAATHAERGIIFRAID